MRYFIIVLTKVIKKIFTFRAKLGVGLLSGKHSKEPDTSDEDDKSRQGISPRMFKILIGRGHSGFASNRQQDAQEFFLHLINILNVNILLILEFSLKYA